MAAEESASLYMCKLTYMTYALEGILKNSEKKIPGNFHERRNKHMREQGKQGRAEAVYHYPVKHEVKRWNRETWKEEKQISRRECF